MYGVALFLFGLLLVLIINVASAAEHYAIERKKQKLAEFRESLEVYRATAFTQCTSLQ